MHYHGAGWAPDAAPSCRAAHQGVSRRVAKAGAPSQRGGSRIDGDLRHSFYISRVPPAPLDPIVSLTVSMAEAPGSHAFFLGSGVSRDSGVPTGVEVYWQAVGELHRLENASAETPDRSELERWLEDHDRTDLGYSGVLELIAPAAGTRRDYLAKHFEGREPGPAHERLAQLAREGPWFRLHDLLGHHAGPARPGDAADRHAAREQQQRRSDQGETSAGRTTLRGGAEESRPEAGSGCHGYCRPMP